MCYKSKDVPIFKTFACNNRYYFYDTYSNYIFEVTPEQFAELNLLRKMGTKNYINLSKENKAYKDILCLLEKGLLKSNFINEIKHPESDYIGFLLERQINDLSLQVTRKCNFNCRYCLYNNSHDFERQHEEINMPWDIAQKSIEYLYFHSFDSKTIGISFYGGEPLMNFSLIKQIVDYSKKIFFSKKITFRMTTNASLFTDEIINFVVNNKFNIAISFDGPEQIQNKHRRFGSNGNETYKSVRKAIERIRETSIDYFTNYISFIAVAFDDEDREKVRNYFESIGIDTEKVLIEDAGLSGIDYIPNILKQSNETNSTKNLLFDSIYSNKKVIPNSWHHNGPCIPGVKRLFVDIHGKLYPCEKIVEHDCLSIGDIYCGINSNKVKQFMNIGKLTENQCKSCWAMRFCDICVASCNDIAKRCISVEQKKLACHFVKEKTLLNFKNLIKKP